MTHAIRITQHGGPEVLQWAGVQVADPAPGELRVRHTAVGLNFIDVYHRSGLYPLKLPSGLGTEAAGVVEAVGAGVDEFKPGDRVAYAGGPLGACAEARCLPAEAAIRLPRDIGDRDAAALMLKGLTSHYLLRRTFPVKRGDVLLVHAAAGGVGSVLVPWAKHLGATVIGTAGSADKRALARQLGCDHVLPYLGGAFAAEVRRLTAGRGVDVVYDSVGKDTFLESLECLRPLGTMVSFGNSSGKPPAIVPNVLAEKGSLFLTRPTLFHYTARREDLLSAAKALFHVMRAGVVKARIGQTFALKDAANAHADLEARKTTGSTVLLP
ncbi:MAG TPA: quinone oxidoreductase [Candidatus Binatia bacterium]|nr:quinone oxidoreductase [Candidatus Binatia bacterium]